MMPGHDPKALVQRLWDFCDVLRDDGLSYGDYLEQLTYLLFLKMSDEQHELLGGERVVPIEYDWQSLLSRSGAALEAHYSEILSELGAGDDMLGVVFHKARNRIQTPAKLEQLIKDFIDKHEWLSYDADLKGAAYEGLIEKTAQEGARGAGQYFTPRGLISAIVDVMLPRPDHRICDPACGTGGFFLGAYCTCRGAEGSSPSRWPAAAASGSCATAASSTQMWSVMLLAAALPGRSMIESGSPCSVAHSIGWNPNPPLKCAAARSLFSECTSTSVESMSSTTGSGPDMSPRRSHTPARTPAAASSSALTTSGPRPDSVRYSVESDATSPNSTRWARRCSMSLHASPPPASINNA